MAKTIPRAYIDGYAESLNLISRTMKAELADSLANVDYAMPVANVREYLIRIMQSHCYVSRAVAAEAAAEFYDGIREFELGERLGAKLYDNYDPVAVERRVRSAVTPLARVQDSFYFVDDIRLDEEYQRELTSKAARDLAKALSDYLGEGVKDAAGNTIFSNGRNDPRRTKFARVPRGSRTYPNGCPFCQMLASRGFAYRSKLTAGGIDPDHYHDDCNCMVVPAWGEGSVEGYNPRDYDAGYQAWLDEDHSQHEANVRERQRNRYNAKGQLQSGSGSRVDQKGALTAEDRALIRSKRTAKGNQTKKERKERFFLSLGVSESEWRELSESEQQHLLLRQSKHGY